MTDLDKELEQILKGVRDAGAVDDSNGAESWTHSDERIASGLAALRRREARIAAGARIDELEHVYPQLMKHSGPSGEGNYYYDERLAELQTTRDALEEKS